MTDINQLKMEARQLLEEVNQQFVRTTGKRDTVSFYNFESMCESSFKNRLKELKQKVTLLQLTSTSPRHRYNTFLSR